MWERGAPSPIPGLRLGPVPPSDRTTMGETGSRKNQSSINTDPPPRISPPARVTIVAINWTDAVSLMKWTEPSTNRALAPPGVEGVDFVVAGAIHHAETSANAILTSLGAGQAGVSEGVGPTLRRHC